MRARPGRTIGVLSTAFGGPYFGPLLGGIAGEVAPEGGSLVAIQTVDAGTIERDYPEASVFPHRVAWDQVAGFVVLLNGVNVAFMEAARSSGHPIVVISHIPVGFSCPTILPDNASGARAATQHLIDHGHRKIAFLGFLGASDVEQRHQAYQQTLLDNGLTPDPDLCFEVDDLQERSGERGGRAMLAAGMPSTAVITANDRNAVGLIRVLTDAGLDLPTDQAVIGFDDNEDGARLTPSLTSVAQPLANIGAKAVRLLIQLIDGEKVANGIHLMPTSLAIRESCGCAGLLSVAAPTTDTGEIRDGANELLPRMLSVLGFGLPEQLQLNPPSEVAVPVAAMVDALRAAVADTEGIDGLAMRRTLSPLAGMLGDNETVVAVADVVRQYGRQLQAQSGLDRDVDATRRVETCLQQIFILLTQAQTALLARHAKSMQGSLTTQYTISLELLRSQEKDPRSLDWLQLTQVRGGCLGLWPVQDADPALQTSLNVIRMFDRELGSSPGQQDTVELTAFPPAALIAMADLARDEMVYIAHLKVGPGDWGMLALVAPIEASLPEGRETMNQWAALLSVALEHEAVLNTMREQEEHLRRAALYDELTGLPNRAFFRTRLTNAIARAGRRADYLYAVLMLDLDGFKLVNDSLGHLAGDRLLQQVATRLTGNLRSIDTAARFGGDEFAVLVEELNHDNGIVSLAERLQKALSAPHDLGKTEVVVSASIGIAIGNADYSDTEQLMRDADAAMYYAKTHGKRSHAIFDPSMHAAAVNRLQIEGELRHALESDELELYYQPIVDLRTGVYSGAEALIRWQHPDRGLLAPGEFLDIAEESGLILPIGIWVLDRACQQLQTWGFDRPGAKAFMMSVNVSNRQFWRSPLIEDVDQRLRSAGLDPSRLAIEITEGVIMDDVKLASAKLNGLKTMGVQVHIDDFGTGYSSLEALHDLSIHALKIDRSFISRLGTSPRSRELVRTIVTMGLNLDLDVIAEGIETPQDLDFVRTLGCTHGQGYFFSRPLPANAIKTQMDTSFSD